MRTRSCLAMALTMRYGAAVDIPINPQLAMEALDSKTCYSTIASEGNLVGYELSAGLLLSVARRLVTLPALGAFEVGDSRRRRYFGHGIAVVIVPRRVQREDIEEEATSIIRERGLAIIEDRGRPIQVPIRVT